MAQTVLIGLGPYRFSVSALNIEEVERSFEYRWEAVNRIGARPAMQFLGPGEEGVRMRGTIYPHYMGGFGQLEQMRSEAAKGKPRGVVSGFGRYYGKWCIRSINDTQSFFLADGSPRKVEFGIELVHYG